MSDHQARYRAALREATAAGLRPRTVEPPHFRLLRSLGLPVRPPHYVSFAVNMMGHGFVFALVWGVLMWLLAWRGSVPAPYAAVAALGAGILFGLVIAFLYRATAQRLGLSRWEDLRP